MNDEYAALVRVTRRPMQRWWRQVGVWWLMGVVVIFAAGHVLGLYASPLVRSIGVRFVLLGHLIWMIRSTAPVAILLAAATSINHFWDNLMSGALAQEFLAQRFRRLVTQAIPIYCTVILCQFSISLMFFEERTHTRTEDAPAVLSSLASASHSVADVLQFGIWLIAFVVVFRSARLAWGLLGVYVVTMTAQETMNDLAPIYGVEPIKVNVIGWVASFLVLLVLIYLLATGRRVLGLVLYGLFLTAFLLTPLASRWYQLSPNNSASHVTSLVTTSLLLAFYSTPLELVDLSWLRWPNTPLMIDFWYAINVLVLPVQVIAMSFVISLVLRKAGSAPGRITSAMENHSTAT